MQAASEYLRKLVDERHSEVRTSFSELLDALAKNDQSEVARTNEALERSLVRLSDVLPQGDWPIWLIDLRTNTERYRVRHNNGLATWIAHLKSLMSHWKEMENHQWFSEDYDPEFNADRIVEAARTEFKINDLFDRVVATLRSLSQCDELDSAKALNDLEEIIRILQKSRSGSFTGQVATWQFTRRFIPNLITAYIKKSSISGPAIEAFEQTAKELDINIASAKDRIAERIFDAAKSSFQSQGIQSIEASQLRALPNMEDSTPP